MAHVRRRRSRLVEVDYAFSLIVSFLFISIIKILCKHSLQSNYTLSNYDTFIHVHTESYRQHYWLFYARLDSHTFIFSFFSYQQ
jgi:hypothetical protein